jgi:hypothetical protein
MVFIAGIPEERIQLSLRRTVVFVAGILEKMIELSLRKLEGFFASDYFADDCDPI